MKYTSRSIALKIYTITAAEILMLIIMIYILSNDLSKLYFFAAFVVFGNLIAIKRSIKRRDKEDFEKLKTG